MNMTHKHLRRFAIFVIAIHFLVSLVHGAAHSHLHLEMKLWENIYILIVITTLPIASGVLIWRGGQTGFQLLFVSMLGALVFGGYYHFVKVGADNVASHGSDRWGQTFLVTAVLLGITEAIGVLTGLAGIRQPALQNL
jgi:hypothetical protein